MRRATSLNTIRHSTVSITFFDIRPAMTNAVTSFQRRALVHDFENCIDRRLAQWRLRYTSTSLACHRRQSTASDIRPIARVTNVSCAFCQKEATTQVFRPEMNCAHKQNNKSTRTKTTEELASTLKCAKCLNAISDSLPVEWFCAELEVNGFCGELCGLADRLQSLNHFTRIAQFRLRSDVTEPHRLVPHQNALSWPPFGRSGAMHSIVLLLPLSAFTYF